MSSAIQKNNKRELIKAIVHTYLKLKGEATAKELSVFINENNLMYGSIQADYISNILSRATVNSTDKRFKTEKGIWSLNNI